MIRGSLQYFSRILSLLKDLDTNIQNRTGDLRCFTQNTPPSCSSAEGVGTTTCLGLSFWSTSHHTVAVFPQKLISKQINDPLLCKRLSHPPAIPTNLSLTCPATPCCNLGITETPWYWNPPAWDILEHRQHRRSPKAEIQFFYIFYSQPDSNGISQNWSGLKGITCCGTKEC